MAINQEIWTDVLVEDFKATEEASFLSEIPDESRFVTATRGENEFIHLVDVGVDPEVLINNTTYPIGSATQVDGDIVIPLDKYQTKATEVSDDELQHIAYDKIRLVQDKHKGAVMRVKHQKAVHALGPNGHTSATPVIVTTGADDGTGRKQMTFKDLITLKKAYDEQEIDDVGRILVLCSDHYNDLLEEDSKKLDFKGDIADKKKGLLSEDLYGFKIYRYVRSPYYTAVSKTKLAFGAMPAAGDYKATISFYAPDMFRASGSTKNYTDEPNTQTQKWMYNIRHNYIVLPRKARAIGAIISVPV